MISLRTPFAAALLVAVATAYGQPILDPIQGLLLGSPAAVSATYQPDLLAGGYRVAYTKKDAFFVIHLPAGTSFAGRSHVDVRLKNNSAKHTEIEVDVSSNNGAGWLSASIVLGPNEFADVAVPLFGGEAYGLRVLPSPTDTSAVQPRSTGNLFAHDVRGVYFFNKSHQAADVSVQLVGATNHNVPLQGIVDTFGQQRLVNWAEKINRVEQMRDMIPLEPNGTYPYATDEYGGIAGSKNYGTSGRFRVVRDGANWFLATPAGNRFFSIGVNEVGAQAYTPVTGRESLFTDLPNLRSNFGGHFKTIGGVEQFTPYSINLERKFGANWRETVIPLFLNRMKSWGFNTVGVSSWDSFMRQQEVPSTFGLNVTSAHPKFHAYYGRSMPDVYSDAWITALNHDIQLRLTESKANQKYNIGIFIDNELPWGEGKNPNINYKFGLAVGVLNSPGTVSHAKLIAQLKGTYTSISALNAAWNTNFGSWSGLSGGGVTFANDAPAAVSKDLAKFTRSFAARYFSSVKKAIVASGYQGLYLGCRFTRVDYSQDVLNIAKKYVDVLSFNIYEASPGQTNEDLKSIPFPIMISEFCFGANDQGRVGMPLYPTLTEKSRIEAYRRFFIGLKSWKNVVGAHWYRWEDFPVTGKADQDNMQEGLITITDRFYGCLVKQTAKSTAAHMGYLKQVP